MAESYQEESKIKPLLDLLNHCRDMLLAVLEIDDEQPPKIVFHIDEEKRKRCKGYYCHATNTISINADIVREGFNELTRTFREKGGDFRDKMRGPKMSELINVLSHELKHRQQNLSNDNEFISDFEIESKLDLNNDEDYRKYSLLNSEIDARAFSRIGLAIVLKDWESFWKVDNDNDLNNSQYDFYLIKNIVMYKDYIPDDIFKKIMEK